MGHLLCWERHERDGSWHAWVSWVQSTGDPVHHRHRIVCVRAGTLRPLEAPSAYKDVPRVSWAAMVSSARGAAAPRARRRKGSRSRRGKDYAGVTISMTVDAGDIAQALTAAWRVFRQAPGDGITGWDTAVATAEIRPLQALTHQAVASSAQSVDARRPYGGAWRPGSGRTGRAGGGRDRAGPGPGQGRGQEMDGLAGLPGLDTVQEQLKGWIAVIRAELGRREAGIAVGRPAWKNLVFTGGPGTGKSRAARAVARIYQELGLLTLGHAMEVAAADLTGTELRETRMLTREAFNRAGGGILMINGAHAWSALPDGGQHVLRCLYQELTSSRDGGRDALAVILAGQAGPLRGLNPSAHRWPPASRQSSTSPATQLHSWAACRDLRHPGTRSRVHARPRCRGQGRHRAFRSRRPPRLRQRPARSPAARSGHREPGPPDHDFRVPTPGLRRAEHVPGPRTYPHTSTSTTSCPQTTNGRAYTCSRPTWRASRDPVAASPRAICAYS